MAAPSNCCTQCGAPTTINVVGLQGQSAFTTTSASFVVPALSASVTIAVLNTDWMAVGEDVFIPGAGLFTVTTIVDQTHVTLTYVNTPANTSTGNTIASGTLVTPSAQGVDGTNGVDAFTVVGVGSPNTPAIGNSISIPVANSSWIVIGQNVFVQGSGYYIVTAKADGTHFTGTYLNVAANTNAGNAITASSGVGPAGTKSNLSAALPTAFTDNSGGAQSNIIAAGVGIQTLTFYVQLNNITAADLIGGFVPGYKFKVLKTTFAVELAPTVAAKAATITPKISGVAVTGGVLALTSANCTPAGAIVNGTAVTAANTGSATDTLSLTASIVTTFTDGNGVIIVEVQNMDVADAVASLSKHVNDLIAALT